MTPLSMVNAPWATLQPGMLGAGGGALPSWLDTASNPGMMDTSGLVGKTGQVGMPQGFFGGGQGLGMNMPTAQLALGGLQTLAGIWGGIQQMKMAKKQLKFSKDFALTNLGNQMQTYNTALSDRARSRGVMEGQTQDQVESYINTNSLTRSTGRAGGVTPSAIAASATANYPGDPDRDPNG